MLKMTKAELCRVQNARLKELVDYADGPHYLAKMLDTPVSTIGGWLRRGRISKKGAQRIEENPALKHKFTADYLRPDL